MCRSALAAILAMNVFSLVATEAASEDRVDLYAWDFEGGSAASAYTLSVGDLVPEGVYDVLADPSTAHPQAVSYADHTKGDGTGLMLALNGATEWKRAWVGPWDVKYGWEERFLFKGYVSTWIEGGINPAQLVLKSLSGSSHGVITAPSTPGEWVEWKVFLSRPGQLLIFDTNSEAEGNDFALDDLSLTRLATTRILPIGTTFTSGLWAFRIPSVWQSSVEISSGTSGLQLAATIHGTLMADSGFSDADCESAFESDPPPPFGSAFLGISCPSHAPVEVDFDGGGFQPLIGAQLNGITYEEVAVPVPATTLWGRVSCAFIIASLGVLAIGRWQGRRRSS